MKPLNKNEDGQKKKSTQKANIERLLLDLGFTLQQIVYDLVCEGFNKGLKKLGGSANWTLEEFKF